MSKKEIRKLVQQVLSKSANLPLQSEFLVSSLLQRKEWQMAKVVAMYQPLKDEPNIDELILQGQRFVKKHQKKLNFENQIKLSKTQVFLSTNQKWQNNLRSKILPNG